MRHACALRRGGPAGRSLMGLGGYRRTASGALEPLTAGEEEVAPAVAGSLALSDSDDEQAPAADGAVPAAQRSQPGGGRKRMHTAVFTGA